MKIEEAIKVLNSSLRLDCKMTEAIKELEARIVAVEVMKEKLAEEKSAIDVVRCKDCKHMTVKLGLRYCKVWQRYNGCGDNGFCCYGQRREE